jgi:hypothetical protein
MEHLQEAIRTIIPILKHLYRLLLPQNLIIAASNTLKTGPRQPASPTSFGHHRYPTHLVLSPGPSGYVNCSINPTV